MSIMISPNPHDQIPRLTNYTHDHYPSQNKLQTNIIITRGKRDSMPFKKNLKKKIILGSFRM